VKRPFHVRDPVAQRTGRIASKWNLFTTPTFQGYNHSGVISYKWADYRGRRFWTRHWRS